MISLTLNSLKGNTLETKKKKKDQQLLGKGDREVRGWWQDSERLSREKEAFGSNGYYAHSLIMIMILWVHTWVETFLIYTLNPQFAKCHLYLHKPKK